MAAAPNPGPSSTALEPTVRIRLRVNDGRLDIRLSRYLCNQVWVGTGLRVFDDWPLFWFNPLLLTTGTGSRLYRHGFAMFKLIRHQGTAVPRTS